MKGQRLARAKEAAAMALDRLGLDDVISVVAYNHKVDVLVPATHARNHSHLKLPIERLTASGRTALYAGVKEGGRQVREFSDLRRVSRVILLSDGLANVGPSKPSELAELGAKLAQDGISVTTIGLGLQYNEDLMAKLALASDGNHAFARTPDDLVRIFDSEFGDVLSVVAQDVIIHIDFLPGFQPRRVFGRQAKISGSRISLKLNQLYASQEKYVIVELERQSIASRSAHTVGSAPIAAISVDYMGMEKSTRVRIERSVSARYTRSPEVAKESINKHVMAQVVTQIATLRSEKAVLLRDKGDIAGARALLEKNAIYLGRKAAEYKAPALKDMERKSREAAKGMSGSAWAGTRKAMRARQHHKKVQQSYQ
jgi:Ca-activated chloride channel family protein